MTVKIDVRVPLEHGVLFLTDPYAEVEVPPDTSAALVTSTSSCTAFIVSCYVDGEAEVTLTDLRPPTDRGPSFTTRLATHSKVLGMSDSSAFNWILMPVKEEWVTLEFWHDVFGEDRVWVRVKEIDSF